MGLSIFTAPNPVILFNGVLFDQQTQSFDLPPYSFIQVFSFGGQLSCELPNSGSGTPIDAYGEAIAKTGSADAMVLVHDKNGASQSNAFQPENFLRLLAQGDCEILVLGYK